MAMGGAVGAIQGGVCGLGPVGMENLLVLVGPSDKMVDDYCFNRKSAVMAHIRTSALDRYFVSNKEERTLLNEIKTRIIQFLSGCIDLFEGGNNFFKDADSLRQRDSFRGRKNVVLVIRLL